MSLADELARLDELRAKGVLTDEEFQRAKSRLLGSAGPAGSTPDAVNRFRRSEADKWIGGVCGGHRPLHRHRELGLAPALHGAAAVRRRRRRGVRPPVDLRAERVNSVRQLQQANMSKSFDVVVIGGGPGGYIAAIRAAQLGLNTACIDDWKNESGGPAPGGTCTNVGCIPSKALLQSSEHFDHAGHHFAAHGIQVDGLKLDLAKMLQRKDGVVKQNNDGILYLFKKNKVSFFHAQGAFAKAGG